MSFKIPETGTAGDIIKVGAIEILCTKGDGTGPARWVFRVPSPDEAAAAAPVSGPALADILAAVNAIIDTHAASIPTQAPPPTPIPARTTRIVTERHTFEFEPGRMALLVALAGAAVSGGVRAGDLRWHGGGADFSMQAVSGEAVPMDAPSVLQLGLLAIR